MVESSFSLEVLRADLRAALDFALGDEPSRDQQILASAAVEAFQNYRSGSETLELVLNSLGVEVFGGVVLHALKHQSSLRGFAESSIYPRSLSYLGIALRDLGWPSDELQWPWRDEAFIEGGIALSPRVNFEAAQNRAAGLGYADPTHRALIEHHLVEHRYHEPRVATVRVALDGVQLDHWNQIIDAFTLREPVHG